MNYYNVWVRSNRYHGDEPLTYAHSGRLKPGQIAEVELQHQLILGFISGPATEPKFKTKEIARVLTLPLLPAHSVRLVKWLQSYYPAPVGIVTQQILPPVIPASLLASLGSADDSKRELDNLKGLAGSVGLTGLPELTDDQKLALKTMQKPDTYILHGETGSGKTRVYIELARSAVHEGKSAIILTPEISLTSQLEHSFKEVFGERVIVFHSQQTPKTRAKAWLRALVSDEPLVVIGPRSALFAPLAKPGLIVLDEAHETAYKQEQTPQYQTGRVAAYLAQMTRSSLVLGTATPLVSDYYLALKKDKPVINMRGQARAGAKTQEAQVEITFVDKKDHAQFSRSNLVSDVLIKSVEQALSNGEQTLLYLNRRGTARMVMCQACGWQALCPHCDLPLTYHGDHHRLRCHSCNYAGTAPAACPNCANPDIVYKTAGTKAATEEIGRLFPHARVARFDTDNLKAERFENVYHTVKDGEVDILVGTQLLAKGIDLPKLSTLGILLADTSLYMPDFSAEERTYQLISQVLGRIGRGHVAGRAIIQTYHPESPILKDAVSGNYRDFYAKIITEREQFMFPPFCYLLKVTFRRASIKAAESAAARAKDALQATGLKLRIEGPAPNFHERFQNKFQWQLVIKSRDRGQLLEAIKHLPQGCSYDIDPMDLL